MDDRKVVSNGANEFYARALSKAERVKLAKARQVVGVDEEIAILRIKLDQLLKENPDKLELLFKGINLLLRAVAIRYKLSPTSQKDLADSINGVLKGIGTAMLPEEFHGTQ